jgi:hypothetical protein
MEAKREFPSLKIESAIFLFSGMESGSELTRNDLQRTGEEFDLQIPVAH